MARSDQLPNIGRFARRRMRRQLAREMLMEGALAAGGGVRQEALRQIDAAIACRDWRRTVLLSPRIFDLVQRRARRRGWRFDGYSQNFNHGNAATSRRYHFVRKGSD